MYDFAIIGAGVIGSMIARELSMYQLNICLLDKGNDVSMGASKANSGIVHAGYDAAPGSLKARLNVEGCAMMEQTARDLDVSYKKCGSLVVAFHKKDLGAIQELYEKGLENNVANLFMLNKEETLQMEPNLSDNVQGALYAGDAGIVCPYGLTIAAAENAVNNGVDLKLRFEVTDIKNKGDHYEIMSLDSTIKSRYIINAAGVFSDEIAKLVGDISFTIIPRRGEYIILDKTEGKTVNSVIFQPPSEKGKGILVTPTVDGNLLLGPTATQIDDKEDIATTSAGLQEVMQGALDAVPALNFKKTITSFSGIRATPSTGDFIIEPSRKSPGVFHAAGIESPGLTAAPAIAVYMVDLIKKEGVCLTANPSSKRTRKGIPRLLHMPLDKRNEYIKKNPGYGNIICRCETVSEGEIIDSIRRPVGATTLDGVKRRVRTGMGRCQGGFCMPKVLEILSRELDISPEDVCKDGMSSKLLCERGGLKR